MHGRYSECPIHEPSGGERAEPCAHAHTSGPAGSCVWRALSLHASSASGCAFVHFTLQHCIEYSVCSTYFKARISGSKWKTGEVASTANKCQETMTETKVEVTHSGAR